MVFQWSSREVPDGDLVVEHAPDAVYSEMFRQVRTGFQFATQSYPGNAYVLTSVGPQEGKSTMISNLGAALAQGGSRVILVDSDLRRPTLYRFVKLDRRPGGLSTVIANGQSPLGHLRETTVPHLRALLSGPVPANPAALLGSPRMEQVIDDLKGDSDYVLLDSPPIMAAADSTILASKVDGVVLVVTLRETRLDTFRDALRQIQRSGTPVVGYVVNKVKPSGIGYGRYRYRYQYYYYRHDDDEEAPHAGNGADPGAVRHRPTAGTRLKKRITRLLARDARDPR